MDPDTTQQVYYRKAGRGPFRSVLVVGSLMATLLAPVPAASRQAGRLRAQAPAVLLRGHRRRLRASEQQIEYVAHLRSEALLLRESFRLGLVAQTLRAGNRSVKVVKPAMTSTGVPVIAGGMLCGPPSRSLQRSPAREFSSCTVHGRPDVQLCSIAVGAWVRSTDRGWLVHMLLDLEKG